MFINLAGKRHVSIDCTTYMRSRAIRKNKWLTEIELEQVKRHVLTEESKKRMEERRGENGDRGNLLYQCDIEKARDSIQAHIDKDVMKLRINNRVRGRRTDREGNSST